MRACRCTSQWLAVLLPLLLLLLVQPPRSCTAGAGKAAKKIRSVAADKKLGQMVEASREQPTNVITLVDSNFTRYVLNTPRPYHLVVLFNAVSPRYKCAQCLVIRPRFQELASSYRLTYNVEEQERPVFWAMVDIDGGSTAFKNTELSSAPHLYILPADVAFTLGRPLPEKHTAATQVLLFQGADAWTPLFEEATGVPLSVVRDMTHVQALACAAAALVGVAAHLVLEQPSRLLALVRSKTLWVLVSLGAYAVGVGGVIYCIIRNPQAYNVKHDPTGDKVVLFSTGSRDQWWWEGVVVAALYLGMAASIWGMSTAVKWQRAHPLLRNLLVCACAAVLCYLAGEFVALYVLKSPWYSTTQMLPPQLAALLGGGTIKRSSGLLQRLVRLATIWLYEYPGLGAYGRKVKTLLLDYVAREAARRRYGL